MNENEHDIVRENIQLLGKEGVTCFKQDIQNQRAVEIAVQWANFNYHLKTIRSAYKKLDTGPYSFWLQNENRRLLLFAVVRAHYAGKKLSVTQTAEDLSMTRKTISGSLTEARRLGLLIDCCGTPYWPTVEVLNVFVRHTINMTHSTTLERFCANILRTKVGVMATPIPADFAEVALYSGLK